MRRPSKRTSKRTSIVAAWLLAAAAAAAPARAQKYEALARTPPMGWNSWNKFACNVSEQLIRETADAMVTTGMRDAGYRYVNIDDCWHGTRDSLGFIHEDAGRFPSGMRALADYVHAKGLRLGIYSDAGSKTCGGRPGSRGHEYQDAITYARWGVDYLKYDWCSTDSLKAQGAYMTMASALRDAGRPVVFSLCEWGTAEPWRWASTVGHLWRTTGDITNCFDCQKSTGSWTPLSVLTILDKQKPLRAFAGPGHWNDPDMLEVGNGMSAAEDRAHFAMWAMLAAPLIAGNDLRAMPRETHALLTNREIIAIDQDTLGVQGFPARTSPDGVEVWVKPLAGGDWAVAMLNRSIELRDVTYDWQREGIADDQVHRRADFRATTYRVRDLIGGRDLGTTARPVSARVAPHDVLLLRLAASPATSAR